MAPRFLTALFVLFLLAGCGQSVDLSLSDPLPLDGVYRSTTSVGSIGQVELTVRKRVKAVRTYNAVLHSVTSEIDDTKGVGTLGNDHLVFNFDIGATDDFYFQGFVQQDTTGAVTGLTGTFIFPGQPEQLSVDFTRIGDAPAEPPVTPAS